MNPIEEWYFEVPPVTRVYGTLIFAVSLLCHFGVLSPFQLYFNWTLVVFKGQWWRLFSTFVYVGPFGLDFLFHMFFALRYSRMLEEGKFRGRTADFLTFFIFSMTLLLLIASIFENMLFLGTSFSFVLVYVWSRHHPHVRMSLLGIFNFSAPFLPWVLIAFSFVMHSNSFPVQDFVGGLVGHVYFFLTEVYSNLYPERRGLLKAPEWFKNLVERASGNWFTIHAPVIPDQPVRVVQEVVQEVVNNVVNEHQVVVNNQVNDNQAVNDQVVDNVNIENLPNASNQRENDEDSPEMRQRRTATAANQ